MTTRIYVVHDTRANPSKPRLVRAVNRAQALRHVAEDAFSIDVASQNSLVFLLGNGIEVEDVSSGRVYDGEAPQIDEAA